MIVHIGRGVPFALRCSEYITVSRLSCNLSEGLDAIPCQKSN